jgi:hypothetical protein
MKRCWFQFRLWWLFIVTAAIAVWLGIEVKDAMRIRRAIAKLDSLKAQIFYDYEWDMSIAGEQIPKRLINAEPSGPEWLRQVVGNEYFVDIVGVTDTTATDKLECLDELPELQCLSVERSKITDAALQRIGSQSQLRYLWLENTAITDTGLKHLRGLKELRYLYMRDTDVTTHGVKELKQFLPNVRVCYGRGEQLID